jgi:hypothetical protein
MFDLHVISDIRDIRYIFIFIFIFIEHVLCQNNTIEMLLKKTIHCTEVLSIKLYVRKPL